jgi:hypothetical protein
LLQARSASIPVHNGWRSPQEEEDDDDDGEEEEGKDSLDGFAVSSSSKEKDAKAQARLKDQREMLEENLMIHTCSSSRIYVGGLSASDVDMR